MTGILDLVAEKRGRFTPEDSHQYVALRLAKQLQAVDGVHTLVSLIEEHSVDSLVNIFRSTENLPTSDRLKVIVSTLSTGH